MSSIKGLKLSPRPWALAAKAPPRLSAGLLLPDAPWQGGAPLQLDHLGDQLGPLDPRLDLDRAFFRIECDDTVEPRRIDQDRIAAELLAAHRVAAAGDGDGRPFVVGAAHDALNRRGRRRLADRLYVRPVQLRVHVVHPDAGATGGTVASGCAKTRRARVGHRPNGVRGYPRLRVVDGHARVLTCRCGAFLWSGR